MAPGQRLVNHRINKRQEKKTKREKGQTPPRPPHRSERTHLPPLSGGKRSVWPAEQRQSSGRSLRSNAISNAECETRTLLGKSPSTQRSSRPFDSRIETRRFDPFPSIDDCCLESVPPAAGSGGTKEGGRTGEGKGGGGGCRGIKPAAMFRPRLCFNHERVWWWTLSRGTVQKNLKINLNKWFQKILPSLYLSLPPIHQRS